VNPAIQPHLLLAQAAEVVRTEAAAIAALESRLDERFVLAVETLVACKGFVVATGVGKAGIVAQKISATLASTGTPSLFLHPTEALHGDLGRIRRDDVLLALSNSGESAEIVALLPAARAIGARIVAITGGATSSLARYADCVLDIGRVQEACPMNLAPTASTTAMLAMGDALAMVVSQARSFSREDYARFHPGGALGRRLMKIGDMMRSGDQLPLLKAGSTLKETVLVMNRTSGRPGAALIVDENGVLVGIFTHGDLARLFERGITLEAGDIVDRHMGRAPKTVRAEALVEDAQRLLHDHRIDQLAVVDEAHRPIGLVDVQDLLDLRV
jgi:arabinose-5-phosphate isomerase